MIVNPADIPQTDKQKKNKTDLHDSRATARYLEKGLLSPIYVMTPEQQVAKKATLPGAPVDEAMYFATAEPNPTASENTYLHQQVLLSSNSPNSTN